MAAALILSLPGMVLLLLPKLRLLGIGLMAVAAIFDLAVWSSLRKEIKVASANSVDVICNERPARFQEKSFDRTEIVVAFRFGLLFDRLDRFRRASSVGFTIGGTPIIPAANARRHDDTPSMMKTIQLTCAASP